MLANSIQRVLTISDVTDETDDGELLAFRLMYLSIGISCLLLRSVRRTSAEIHHEETLLRTAPRCAFVDRQLS